MVCLVNLLSVGAPLGKAGLTTSRLAKHDITVPTEDHCLGVTEDSRNLKASWTLNIHEKRIGRLHKSLQLVSALFAFGSGV